MITQTRRIRTAFTLIELLIVVVIIAILAAIAVPNFLEVQVRSKVSKVRADQRSLATALESYRIDTNYYPLNAYTFANGVTWVSPSGEQTLDWGQSTKTSLWRLTTPVAYVVGLKAFDSPFSTQVFEAYSDNTGKWIPDTYWYIAFDHSPNPSEILWYYHETMAPPPGEGKLWFLADAGPDKLMGWMNSDAERAINYDPTNGTVSVGDIYRFGP